MSISNPEKLAKIKLPKGIAFIDHKDTLLLIMNRKGTSANMQTDAAAFEAWALVAKAHGYNKVQLIEDESNEDFEINKSNPTYNRFLYRVLRFWEGFNDWFSPDEELLERAHVFEKKFLQNTDLFLSPPEYEASLSPSRPEAIIESRFGDPNNFAYLNRLIRADCSSFFRQLPVGLYHEKIVSANAVFSSGSADLWGLEGPVFHLIELKTGNNKSIGVLSELYFYACFIRDMFINNMAVKTNSDYRGYNELLNADISSVNAHIVHQSGCMHPQLSPAFKELQKCSLMGIKFCTVADYRIEDLVSL